jgi:hypothetical protein
MGNGGGAVGAPSHRHRNGRSSLGMAAANADGLLIANKMMPTATARQTTTIPMPMARAMINSASGGIKQLGGQRTPSGPTWGGLYLRLPGWCRETVRHGYPKLNRQGWLLCHPIRNALQPTDAVMVGPTDRFVEGHVPRRRSDMDDTHHRSSMQQVVSFEPHSRRERSATPSLPKVPRLESPTVGAATVWRRVERTLGSTVSPTVLVGHVIAFPMVHHGQRRYGRPDSLDDGTVIGVGSLAMDGPAERSP